MLGHSNGRAQGGAAAGISLHICLGIGGADHCILLDQQLSSPDLDPVHTIDLRLAADHRICITRQIKAQSCGVDPGVLSHQDLRAVVGSSRYSSIHIDRIACISARIGNRLNDPVHFHLDTICCIFILIHKDPGKSLQGHALIYCQTGI